MKILNRIAVLLCLTISFSAYGYSGAKNAEKYLEELTSIKEELRQEKINRVNEKIANYNTLKSLEMKVYSVEDTLADLKNIKYKIENELTDFNESLFQYEKEYVSIEDVLKDINEFIEGKVNEQKERLNKSVPFKIKERGAMLQKNFSIEKLMEFLKKEIAFSEMVQMYNSKVDGIPVTIIRIGNIFGAYEKEDNEYALLESSYKKGQKIYRWNKNQKLAVREKLFSLFKSKDFNKYVYVPIDVTQGAKSDIGIERGGLINWIKKGGPVMIPIGLLFLAIIMMSGERIIALKREGADTDFLMNRITQMWKKGEHIKAIELCRNTPGPVARMLKIGLEQISNGKEVVEDMFHEQHLEEIPRLQKHLSTIAVLAGAAPLLGLLGTVSGMISTFKVIVYHGGGDPKLLAGGISEALITTQAGLIVAIPALLIHNYLSNRAEDMASAMEKNSVKFVNSLCGDERKVNV